MEPEGLQRLTAAAAAWVWVWVRPTGRGGRGRREGNRNVLDPFFHGYQSNTSYQVPHGWYLQLCDRYELCLASHLLVSVAGSGTAVRPYSCRTTAVQRAQTLLANRQRGLHDRRCRALSSSHTHTHTLTTDRAAHRRSTPTTARAKAKARTYIPVQP